MILDIYLYEGEEYSIYCEYSIWEEGMVIENLNLLMTGDSPQINGIKAEVSDYDNIFMVYKNIEIPIK